LTRAPWAIRYTHTLYFGKHAILRADTWYGTGYLLRTALGAAMRTHRTQRGAPIHAAFGRHTLW